MFKETPSLPPPSPSHVHRESSSNLLPEGKVWYRELLAFRKAYFPKNRYDANTLCLTLPKR